MNTNHTSNILVCGACRELFSASRTRKYCSEPCRRRGIGNTLVARLGKDYKPNARTLTNRRYRARHPEKVLAHGRLKEAVKAGRIVKPASCEWCTSSDGLHAHHFDYEKAASVVWLCNNCHENHHHPHRVLNSDSKFLTLRYRISNGWLLRVDSPAGRVFLAAKDGALTDATELWYRLSVNTKKALKDAEFTCYRELEHTNGILTDAQIERAITMPTVKLDEVKAPFPSRLLSSLNRLFMPEEKYLVKWFETNADRVQWGGSDDLYTAISPRNDRPITVVADQLIVTMPGNKTLTATLTEKAMEAIKLAFVRQTLGMK